MTKKQFSILGLLMLSIKEGTKRRVERAKIRLENEYEFRHEWIKNLNDTLLKLDKAY